MVRRHEWAPGLITLGLDSVVEAHVAGQFVNLAIERDGAKIKRSYSLASAPGQPSEFYVTEVQGGVVTPSLLSLSVGDPLWVDDRALGFFTLDHVPAAPHVWLLATGTGLGPFIAMLRSPTIWERFSRIVLIHGVRHTAQLGYMDELSLLARRSPEQLSYVPLVTREVPPPFGLAGRLPALVRSGELERRAGVLFAPGQSQVLLCGNPEMISETQRALGERGLEKHRAKKPGHVTLESYW